jgi:hypothetical protein
MMGSFAIPYSIDLKFSKVSSVFRISRSKQERQLGELRQRGQ